jgi:DNA-binding IclR family transcriptional regulator
VEQQVHKLTLSATFCTLRGLMLASERRARARPGDGTSPGVQTVTRALAVLDALARSPGSGLPDLARQLNLHPSTARRLLTVLEANGYVRLDPPGYTLGFRLVELAGHALNHTDLVRHSLSELDRMRDRLRLNANLAVLAEGDVLHLAYAVRSDTPRYYTAIGRRAVAHCTALGKVLLSAQPRERVHETVERFGWRPYTPHSIQDLPRLDRELDQIATLGYAVDREERKPGSGCLAAPVRDRSRRVVAAISVSGTLAAIERIGLERIQREVMEHARQISAKLGCLDD